MQIGDYTMYCGSQPFIFMGFYMPCIMECMCQCACRYDNELLVEYNVQCEANQVVLYDITDLQIQGEEDCQNSSGNKT